VQGAVSSNHPSFPLTLMHTVASPLQVACLCCAVLCCAVLCCAVLCCAVLCCAVLCCAVLCCAVLLAVVLSELCGMEWCGAERVRLLLGCTTDAGLRERHRVRTESVAPATVSASHGGMLWHVQQPTGSSRVNSWLQLHVIGRQGNNYACSDVRGSFPSPPPPPPPPPPLFSLSLLTYLTSIAGAQLPCAAVWWSVSHSYSHSRDRDVKSEATPLLPPS
jgi:hypothetical protein